jgi:hypothetical protein
VVAGSAIGSAGAAGTTVPYATVPYAAVLFDAEGATWADAWDGGPDTAEEGLSFLRQTITVDRFEGDLALLAQGPPVGTWVVTTGAAELFGTELDVGH